MKKLSDIKNEKSLQEIFDKAMDRLVDDMKGLMVVDKARNFRLGMIVNVIPETRRDGRKHLQGFQVKLLVDEKVETRRFESWHDLTKNLKTQEEYEKNKDIYQALSKTSEKMSKAMRQRHPRKRVSPSIRFK